MHCRYAASMAVGPMPFFTFWSARLGLYVLTNHLQPESEAYTSVFNTRKQ